MPNNFEEILKDVNTAAPRRVWATVEDEKAIITKLNKDYDFWHLATITGVENADNFEILYHLTQKGTGVLLTLSRKIALEGGSIESISDIFPSAAWYERELNDLFGIQVNNVPAGSRYPLPDEWPHDNHPLRKNWKAPQEVK